DLDLLVIARGDGIVVVVNHDAVATFVFRAVTGDVGAAHQFGQGDIAGGKRYDADAGADREGAALPAEMDGVDLADQLFANTARMVGGAVGQYQAELIAAEPGEYIVTAHAQQQALCDLPQQHVAGGVAGAVVENLEAVGVDETHAVLALLRVAAGEHVAEYLLEAGAIEQAGQAVVAGAVFKFFLQFGAARFFVFALLDVFDLGNEIQKFLLIVAGGGHGNPGPEAGAVLAHI